MILARLLSPQEIGTFAIAIVFSEIGRAIAVEGMVQNIPRQRSHAQTGPSSRVTGH
ncbi:MAG: oligosaccharide flippase family protein [Gammaproteobacteria bacterium]